ncbi:MAG: ATP-binding protein [bacterium]|nr:ATP-binding protein [bacterium]
MSKARKINFTILYYLCSLVVLIIINGFLIFYSNKKVDEASALKASIQIIETNLDGIESGVLRGFDAGLRGYAFVQDDEILHPYLFAFDLSEEIFARLDQEVRNFHYDPAKISKLKNTIDSYGNYMEDLKQMVDDGDLESFRAELSKNKGDEIWQEYNLVRVDLKNYLGGQIIRMNEEIESFQKYTYLTQLISIALVVVILFLIYKKIVSFAREKNDYIDRIEVVNSKLEESEEFLREEVASKTKDLRVANSELKDALEEMKTMQSYMLQSEKMTSLGTMTAGITHEFNNALNHIKGGVQIINQSLEEPDEEMDEEDGEVAKNIMDDGIKRISKIVNSLQVFSNRSDAEVLKTDIHELIENSIVILKSKIDDDIELIKKLELQKELYVKRADMQQVIVQLIDNAIFAVNSHNEIVKKKIEISTRQESDKALIEICNNGPVIPEEKLRELFDPFYTTKAPGVGTGLGLSICYSVVTSHDGAIYARNEDGLVKFQVELPT